MGVGGGVGDEEGRNTTLLTQEGVFRGSILEGEAGFEGHGGHVGGAQSLAELGGRKKEIDLTGQKLVVEGHRGNEIVVVQAVGVAKKGIGGGGRGVFGLKNAGNGDGSRVLPEIAL